MLRRFSQLPVVAGVLLLLLLVAFGLLIPSLGFYWDDWPVILLAHFPDRGGFWAFYAYDRPFSAWTYLLTLPWLGVTPWHWHGFTLVLRWLMVVTFWGVLRQLWPHHARQATWAALLFAVYPSFTQQSIAVAYSQHFLTGLLFMLSCLAMLMAVRRPRYALPLTVLALLTQGLHLATMEYFLGLELLRPWLLYLALPPAPRRGRWALRRSLPYLLVLGGYLGWRLFLAHIPHDPNDPYLLRALLSNPLPALQQLLQTIGQDGAFVLFTVWARILQPDQISLAPGFTLLSWGIAALSSVALGWFLARTAADASPAEGDAWAKQALWLGIAALLLGALPAWLIGKQILRGLYSDRFSLAAMPGASLVVIAVLDGLRIPPRRQSWVLAVLLGLAVGYHLRIGNQYRWDWAEQRRFYWQLVWRAPDILPGTPLLSARAVSGRVDVYVASAAINTLYAHHLRAPEALPYWFFSIERSFGDDLSALVDGVPIGDALRTLRFSGHSQQALVVWHNPDLSPCLRMLMPTDVFRHVLDHGARQVLPIARPERIQPNPATPVHPEAAIFGPEPLHDWCYYYQRAALAQQQGDWATIVRLAQEAHAQGLSPYQPFEMQPFIMGYAHQGDWERAAEITLALLPQHTNNAHAACTLWAQLLQETPPSAERDAAYHRVRQAAGCVSPP